MIDMHLHSTFSYDGKAEVEDIIAQVQKLGINHFCITDHYEYENGNSFTISTWKSTSSPWTNSIFQEEQRSAGTV